MPLKKYTLEEEKPYRTLTLVVTRNCNLSCKYCYEKKYLRDKRIMGFEVAKNKIGKYLKEKEYDELFVDFFGGEPFLAFSLIKKTVEWFRKEYYKKTKKRVSFGIQTNATLLTDEIKKWIIDNKDLVSVGYSLDGIKEAHDLNRCNSFDDVYSNIEFFKEHFPEQPPKMTINDLTIPYLSKSVIFLESLRINFNGGIITDNIWGSNDKKKRLLEKLKKELDILIEFYLENDELKPPLPLFPKFPEVLNTDDRNRKGLNVYYEDSEITRFCGAGHGMVGVDVDGEEYPCFRFLPFITGKQLDKNKEYNKQKNWKNERCNNCILVSSCPTCVGYNWEENGDTAIRTEYHCEAYRLSMFARLKYEAKKIESIKVEDLNEEEKVEIANKVKIIRELSESSIFDNII